MEKLFEEYAATCFRGKRLPAEWTQEQRAEYKKWHAKQRNRKHRSNHPFSEKSEEEKELVRLKDKLRHSKRKLEEFEDPELKEKRRKRDRKNEEKYRETHQAELRERGRTYERTEHRKQLKRKWKGKNIEITREYTRTYLDKKHAEDPTGFREKEAERLRTYRKTESYSDYIDERKGDVKYQWTVLKAQAKQRHKQVELTFEEFERLFKEHCHYCGDEARGLDRVDNSGHYTSDNVVSCCALCNYMKRDHAKEKFIDLCRHLAQMENRPELFERASRSSYVSYVHRALEKDIPFTIPKKEFEVLFIQNCFYCQLENAQGVDRIDSKMGYTPDNVVSCCKTCNYMKRQTPVDVFFKQVKKLHCFQNRFIGYV